MNTFDFILIVILFLAAVDGWRQGVIAQVCGIAGLVFGIWLGMRFSHAVGAWLHLGDKVSSVLGFIAILILSIVALGVVGWLFKRVFRLTGFGLLDNIGGLALGVLKAGLMVYFLTGFFVKMNDNLHIVPSVAINNSKVYSIVGKVNDAIFPYLIKSKDKLLEVDAKGAVQPEAKALK